MIKTTMNRLALPVLASFMIIAFPACSQTESSESHRAQTATLTSADLSGLSKAYFASGCFWCVEAVYESVEGVAEAVSGYSGGAESNPTYREVSNGVTGHAEAVEVYYDSTVVDFPTLVKVYYGSHDPTTRNRQGPDRGAQYRSVAFYQNAREKEIIESFIEGLYSSGEYERGEIVTEVTEFDKFWPAEGYHQNYEKRNPDNPYVRNVSVPRLNRFLRAYPELLKAAH